MRFAISNVAAEFRRFEARKSALFKPLRDIVTEVAKDAQAEAKATIRRRKSGRHYGRATDRTVYQLQKIGGRRVATRTTAIAKAYVASAAGEAPASRTGTLLRSVRRARLRKAEFGFFVFANSRTAFYRHFLEFGTRARRGKGGDIAPRPLFTPLALKYERLLASRIEREIEPALREVLK